MAMIEEGWFCRDDTDCPDKQYCYHVSTRCVDYTQCSRYNRQENRKRSRHPSQCGPCLSGYAAEELGTGEVAWLCRKTNLYESDSEIGRLSSNAIIYTSIGIALVCLVVTIATIFFCKRRGSKRRSNNPEHCGDLCVIEPSAPPIESRPFINCSEESPYLPFNNNKNVKDKNKLVHAAAFKPPNWVCSNPNYENNLSNDNVNALDQLHSRTELPPADDNSNTWVPQQLSLAVINGNTAEYRVEQVDNSANAVLVQRNNPSSSNAAEEDSNNNNNSNDSTSESSNAQDGRERGRSSNILIAQTISMNVNVLNGDC